MLQSWTDPVDFGLTPGSEPVRWIKPKTGRKTTPGWFPTRKGVAGSIRVETGLERRGLAQFEINPDVVLMAGQPHHLVYYEKRGHRVPKEHVYTPDVALLMRDGRVAVVDFKATRYARKAEWLRLKPLIEAAYANDHGVVFTVRTELEIDVEPRASNVARMMMSRPTRDDEVARMAVRSAMLALGMPTTVGAVTAVAALDDVDPHVDRAFAALVELAIAGEIELDLGRPFDDVTLVRERRIDAGRRAADAA